MGREQAMLPRFLHLVLVLLIASLPAVARSLTSLAVRAAGSVGTVHFTVADVCGSWPTFVGGVTDAGCEIPGFSPGVLPEREARR